MNKRQKASKAAFQYFLDKGWNYNRTLSEEEAILADAFDLDNGKDVNSKDFNLNDILDYMRDHGWSFWNSTATYQVGQSLLIYRKEMAPKKSATRHSLRNKLGQFHTLRPGSVYWVAGALARCKSAENKTFSVHGALNGTVTDLSRVRLATKDEVETYLAESKSNG